MGTILQWTILFFEALLITGVGNLQVTVTIQGTDSLNSDIFNTYMVNKSFEVGTAAISVLDDTQLSVVLCGVNTYSDDHSGVCKVCDTCPAETYQNAFCEPWHDTGCVQCTKCNSHEIMQCECGVLTPDCYTGDRVCQHVLSTNVHLNVSLRSNTKLTVLQVQLVSLGLATGYIPWLQSVIYEDNITFDGLLTTGPLSYMAMFTIMDVYNTTTLQFISNTDASFYQTGLLYTFGGFRRRLLGYTGSLVTAVGASTSCEQTTTCPEFQTLSGTGACSDNICVPLPCPIGYTGNFAICTLCPQNTYKDVEGNSTCTQCPTGSISPTGSNSSGACIMQTTTSTTPVFTTTAARTSTQPTTSTTTRTQPPDTTSQTTIQTTSTPTTEKINTSTTEQVTSSTSTTPPTNISEEPVISTTSDTPTQTTKTETTISVTTTTQTGLYVTSSTPVPTPPAPTPSVSQTSTPVTNIPSPSPYPSPATGGTNTYHVSTRSQVTVYNNLIITQQGLDMRYVYAASACIAFLAVLILMKKNTVIVVQGNEQIRKPILPFKLMRYKR